MELKPCPNCGSVLIRHNKRKGKHQYECDGDCWTRTKWHWSEMEAKEEWNNLKKEPVVRCEDCRFLKPDVDESYICRKWKAETDLDGFCYLGRRRDR